MQGLSRLWFRCFGPTKWVAFVGILLGVVVDAVSNELVSVHPDVLPVQYPEKQPGETWIGFFGAEQDPDASEWAIPQLLAKDLVLQSSTASTTVVVFYW